MQNEIVPWWCINSTLNLTKYLVSYHCSKIEINMTSCRPIQSESEMDTIRIICETGEIIWYSFFWFSIAVGIVGNSLAFITVASLPVSIATFYVGLLAVSDFVALLLQLVMYFLHKERLINPTTPYWYIFPMLFDFTMSYSNWLLVLICLDRFISIRYPLKRRFYFTIRHAIFSAITIGIILFAIYFAFVQALDYMDTRMFTVRNLLYSQIPLVFILVLIILITIQFKIIRRKRKFLSEGGNNSAGSGKEGSRGGGGGGSSCFSRSHSPHKNRNHSHRQSERSTPSPDSTALLRATSRNNSTNPNHQKNNNHSNNNSNSSFHRRSNVFEEVERLENNITIMMLITAICFAILTIPNCLVLFTYKRAHTHWNTPLARARWHIFNRTSNVLTIVNLSINFILYFFSAKKFRHQLCRLLKCKGKKLLSLSSTHQQHLTLVPKSHEEQSETIL